MLDEFFMDKALEQANNAFRAGEFPVGCIVAYAGKVLVTGARIGTTVEVPNEVNHAEMIALRRLAELPGKIERRKAALYTTLEPCLMCFGAILLSGVPKIVYAYEDVMGGGTKCDLSLLNPLYANRNIEIVTHVRRKESLTLFKTYFENPKNQYWRGSLLATYTANQ